MSETAWTRAGALYLPLMAALLAGALFGRRPRQFPACLTSVLWAMTSLLAVQRINQLAGWWTFSADGALFCGMPLELYLGWVLLWGIVPQLAFPQRSIAWCASIMVAVDLLAMPMCKAVVHLGPSWLLGELVAVLLVLLPALCIARWTLNDTHLHLRATLQIAIAGLLFLFLLPEVIFALRPGEGWAPFSHLPGWRRQLELQILLLLALPGVAAVMEFAERGQGTPIPYDPPRRLVTSGIYRYCANPMQLSCGLVMLFWASLLQNGWLLLAAAMSVIYSAGLAEWDEREDLARRFGAQWCDYRAAVHNWRPRWTPYHAGPAAQLYIASSCGPCSELRFWLETRDPIGLLLVNAETLPKGSIRRMRYDPGDGSDTVDGVRALGRALEHLHLGWAIAGAALRLPIVWHGVQLVMDASGLGPRLPKEAH
ncbi:MAG TPA: methyltransferase [Edaphobacter sp.]|nr:methyltransferase [Edaphobacter sp.]